MAGLYHISSAPHVRSSLTTQKIMLRVILALMPATLLGIYHYGMGAVSVILACVLSSVLSEAVFNRLTKRKQTVKDASAAVTGLMLALILPPELPLYIPVLGGIFAILVVKCLFGGLGHNFMNPALAARCFLLISFGTLMTVYKVDGIATATPLAEAAAGNDVDLMSMFWGSASGVIGSSAFGVLLGGMILLGFGLISYEIPLTILLSFTIFWGIFGGHGFDPHDLLIHLMGGGILLGAFFMATDYVTSPVTSKGQLVFGTIIGIFMGLFHVYGTAPDSGSYAIILANMLVPLIDEFTVPTAYGYRKERNTSGFLLPKPALVLFVITLIAGAALSGVYEMTKDTIEEQKLLAEAESYRTVCPEAADFVTEEKLRAAVEALDGEVYGSDFGNVFIDQAVTGKTAAGETAGYVLRVTTKDGYDDQITIALGIDRNAAVTGLEFIKINETAGMGMLCAEPEFKDQFKGSQVERFVLNKAGGSFAPEEIDSVSGASRSSGAVVNAVNAALDFYTNVIKPLE